MAVLLAVAVIPQARNVAVAFVSDLFLQNIVVNSGVDQFYEADRITVAGPDEMSDPTHFIVEDGGGVELLANEHVTLSPGFHAEEGSQFEAFIGSISVFSRLFVDDESQPKVWVEENADTRPDDASLIDQNIASKPLGIWLGDWHDAPSYASSVLVRADAAGEAPVFVMYNIPQRDCGGFSSGGASSHTEYRTWIDDLATAIGIHEVVIVVEPDALPALDCLSPDDQADRIDSIAYAAETFGALPGAHVYLDAGHSNWQPVATMSSRLNSAQVNLVRGFSLNVSNFRDTAELRVYADELAAALGDTHYVLDTSRNGNGPDPGNEWCNPPGRALGLEPTSQPTSSTLDAYIWVKVLGESDGSCNGGPPAGEFWPEYALELIENAS